MRKRWSVRILVAMLSGLLASLVWAIVGVVSPAAAWSDIPSAMKGVPCTATYVFDCAPDSYILDLTFGVGDPVGDGQVAKLFRKVGKKWVPVPSSAASVRTGWEGTGRHSVVYPQADRFVPGTYMLVFTQNSRAQWKCSVYWKDVCRWVDASSSSTKYRFQWSGEGLSGTQVAFDFR